MTDDLWRELAEEIARGIWSTNMRRDFDNVVDEIERRIKEFAKRRIIRTFWIVERKKNEEKPDTLSS